jgi:hypothetical protein
MIDALGALEFFLLFHQAQTSHHLANGHVRVVRQNMPRSS